MTAVIFVKQLSFVTAMSVPINTPSPMMQPSYPACAQFHLAGVGEDCNAIISAARIDRAEFFRINPAVGGEEGRKDRIVPHTWYCIMSRGGPVKAAPSATAGPGAESTTKVPQKSDLKLDSTKSRHETQSHRTKDAGEAKVTSVAPEDCRFGDCWYAFGTLSTGDAQKLASATSLCHLVFA